MSNQRAIASGTSTFSHAEALRKGGAGGSHAVLLYDYDAVLADGTHLAAGVNVADRSLLRRALQGDTKFGFWRVQNSWGTNNSVDGLNLTPRGSYDIEQNYLSTPMATTIYGTDNRTLARSYWEGAALPANVELL